MNLSSILPLALVLIVQIGCGTQSPSGQVSQAESNLHKWTTSAPIHSYEWFVNGKEAGGGSQAEFSDQVQMNFERSGNRIHWTMQIGSQSGSGSDSIQVNPATTTTTLLPPDGILAVSGPTSLCRIEERGANGQLVKTTELIVK